MEYSRLELFLALICVFQALILVGFGLMVWLYFSLRREVAKDALNCATDRNRIRANARDHGFALIDVGSATSRHEEMLAKLSGALEELGRRSQTQPVEQTSAGIEFARSQLPDWCQPQNPEEPPRSRHAQDPQEPEVGALLYEETQTAFPLNPPPHQNTEAATESFAVVAQRVAP